MKIKWVGLQKLINSFKRSRQRLYERRLENVAQRVKGHVVDEAPPLTRDGWLEQSRWFTDRE